MHQFKLRLLILVSSLIQTPCVAQETDPQKLPDFLEASSVSWVNKLECYGRFRYSEKIIATNQNGKKIVRKTVANGRGELAINPKIFRLKIEWEKLTNSKLRPYMSVDFVSSAGFDAYKIEPGLLVNRASVFEKQMGLMKKEKKVRPINLGGELRILHKDTVRYAKRFPLIRPENPIGFCGGWKNGTVFGGVVSETTTDILRKHFARFQFGGKKPRADRKKGFVSIELQKKGTGYVVESKLFSKSGQVTTFLVEFQKLDGLLLKIRERCVVTDKTGETKHRVESKIEKFIQVNGVVVPLAWSQETQFDPLYGEGNVLVKNFRFEKESLRTPKDSDFEIPIGAAGARKIGSLKSESNTISLKEILINKRKQLEKFTGRSR